MDNKQLIESLQYYTYRLNENSGEDYRVTWNEKSNGIPFKNLKSVDNFIMQIRYGKAKDSYNKAIPSDSKIKVFYNNHLIQTLPYYKEK